MIDSNNYIKLPLGNKVKIIPGKIQGTDVFLVRNYNQGSIHIYRTESDIVTHIPATDLEAKFTYRELTAIWSKFLKQYNKSLKGDNNHGC